MRIALVQLTPAQEAFRNADLAVDAIADAARRGARLVVLPEATLTPFGTDLAAAAAAQADVFDARVTEAAELHDVVVVVGSFATAPHARVHNRVIVRGRGVHADYDKIHLFDAFGTRESDTVAPGTELLTVDVDDLRIGLATCYDVRFPEQFRALAQAGADAIVAPAAWGDGEGKLEQWSALVRARALDATAYVLAADQAPPEGDAPGPRGVGHSTVVSPLGAVLGELGREPGVLLADLDPAVVASARETLPVLRHIVPLSSLDVEERG